ncbi:MAG: (Fe-S)-binding protein [Promethearchaeota archaeon]
MFNEETCEICGKCLFECPFLEISTDKAQKEIENMIKFREISELMKNCLGCGYCNIICPNQANPADLIREINRKNKNKRGIRGFSIIHEDVPVNLMTVGLEMKTAEKKKLLKKYLNPPKSEKMYYLGCSLSYIYTDLVKTKLLDDLPKIGGMKYCCGIYLKSYSKEEINIRGMELLKEFKKLGIRELVVFCPGCAEMLRGVYPKIIPQFKEEIRINTISEHLIDMYNKDDLNLVTKIDKKIAFQDPCGWRNLDRKIYEAPRALLEILGAEVVEMKHNREKSLCCGVPVLGRNINLFKKISEMSISEAEESGSDIIALSCTGCLGLARNAAKRNIQTYNITELAQIAIGENPPHQVVEVTNKLNRLIGKKFRENSALLTDRYTIKNGNIHKI